MGFLICDKCEGYYELKNGERPEDFDRCECGGKLEYTEGVEKKTGTRRLTGAKYARKLGGVLIGAAVIAVSFYISSPDPNHSNFAYYNTISPYLWGAGGLVAALLAGGNIRSAVASGFCAALISGLMVLIFYYYTSLSTYLGPSTPDNMALLGALGVIFILIPGVLAVAGGLTGGIARKIVLKITKYNKG